MRKTFLSVDVKEGDRLLSKDVKLTVKTNGHVLHVFVKGAHVGKLWLENFFPISHFYSLTTITNCNVIFFLPFMCVTGSQYAQTGHYDFVYEANVKLKRGNNEITLLSSTVGLTVSN